MLQMKASASPLSPHLASALAAIVFLHESGDWDAVAAAEPKIHLNRVPWSDSSQPQYHRELLHVRDHTVIAFSPQVEHHRVAMTAAGRARTRLCRLSPLLSHLFLALGPGYDADARRVTH